MTELSDWGRWGKEDEMRTLNRITPARRKAVALLVREGSAISLAHDVEKAQAADNPRPFVREILVTGQTADATSHGDSFTICADVCVGAIAAVRSARPSRSCERSDCCCRPGNRYTTHSRSDSASESPR